MVEFRLIMKVRMKVRVFSSDSLNKNIPKKKLSCLKKVLLKCISHQAVFSRKDVLKIQTNHNGFYKT